MRMPVIDLSKVPEQVKIDLCTLAIRRCAEAMKTPEGRAAIEKDKEAYLRLKAGQANATPLTEPINSTTVIYRNR